MAATTPLNPNTLATSPCVTILAVAPASTFSQSVCRLNCLTLSITLLSRWVVQATLGCLSVTVRTPMRWVRPPVMLAAILTTGVLTFMGNVPAQAETTVVVTIKPLHALVAEVMRGVGEPVLLVKASSSPHTYALKPSDVATLNHCDVFFRTSDALEPFTTRIIAALPNQVTVISLLEAPGVMLLARRTGPSFERHAHTSYDMAQHNGDHTHPSAADGHAWLDTDNAKAMVEHIAVVLSAKDPAHRATFSSNAETLQGRLDRLGTELASTLRPVASKPYIVFHDALQYFERRFGLNDVGSISLSPEIPPGAKRLTQLREKIKALGALCVFAEPQFGDALVRALIEGTAAQTGTLDPEGSKLAPGPDLYFAIMRRLASDLTRCLSLPG
jgi:zinc transport system substrate-binding protein